ncbi:MAG: sugar-binding protein [Clostridia bacterium]|nr:sugar ABC transporter substrate-binding protein [Clostridia bacterium]PZN09847.1 MAG: sugar ABC transporter substrate-binding protein [Caldicoprobacter oshimai]
MKRFLKYSIYYLSILVFIGFNVVLLDSLRYDKPVEEEIKPKIVLISHVYSNPYWKQVRAGAEKAAKERGVIIDFQGPDTASVEEGIRFIKMAYAAKVSGIIAYVQDETQYNDVINKVIDGGIPLVTIDSDAENSKRLAYVGTDNVEAGRVGGREVIRQIGTEGKVAIIMGGKTVKNQVERVKGFKSYIDKNSNIVIAAIESSDSYLLEAELAAKKILNQHPDVKALFCTSALDGLGAAKAVKSLGLVGKVKIICFDDLPETLDNIEKGIITSTVVQQPYLMGYKAVHIIMDNIEGKTTKGSFITDVLVVDKEDLEDYKIQQQRYYSEIQ